MSKLGPELDEKIKKAYRESTEKYAAKKANMENATPTPGPWEFRMYAGGCTIVSAHDEPGTSVRALLKGVTVSVDAFIYDDQSNAAQAPPDARLIVSSPEMLAALEATEAAEDHWANCAVCEQSGAQSPELGCETGFNLADKARRLRRAAIAKARGRDFSRRTGVRNKQLGLRRRDS